MHTLSDNVGHILLTIFCSFLIRIDVDFSGLTFSHKYSFEIPELEANVEGKIDYEFTNVNLYVININKINF